MDGKGRSCEMSIDTDEDIRQASRRPFLDNVLSREIDLKVLINQEKTIAVVIHNSIEPLSIVLHTL